MVALRARGNVPKAPLRWSIDRWSTEFKLAANTLRKYLTQGGAEPDQTGCYTTTQICEALYGDLKAERLRKERELTRRYQLENEITEATVVNRAELMKGLAALADAMVSRIMSANVDRSIKEDLLHDLSTVPLVLREVADKQSKLRRNGNGSVEVI
jgi:hypothetical protein